MNHRLSIMFASHTAMGGPFVVGSHHLAHQFAALGHRVLHVSTPLTAFHLAKLRNVAMRSRWKTWRSGGVRMDDGVIDYVPFSLLPWQASRYVPFALTPMSLCVPSVRSTLSRLGFDQVDLLLVDQPKMIGIERLVVAERLVYRATDLYAEMTGDPSVSAAERELVRKSDLVVGTSLPVLDHLRALHEHPDTLLLENGVELARFTRPSELPAEYRAVPEPRAVYVGAMDARLSHPTLAHLCRSAPGLNVVLIGPDEGLPAELKALPNLFVLGPKPYDRIPGFLQHAQVGLLPLSGHSSNSGRSPMKLYEYAAAGLPVVATSTPELQRRSLPFALLASGPEEFADNVARLIGEPGLARTCRTAARASALDRDWSAIAKRLLQSAMKRECSDSVVSVSQGAVSR